MHKAHYCLVLSVGLALVLGSAACGAAAPAATKAADELAARIKGYPEKGYLSKTGGTLYTLLDYKKEYAYMGYLGDSAKTGYSEDVKDFVFTADFQWGSAVPNPETSGCGLYFREQQTAITTSPTSIRSVLFWAATLRVPGAM